MRQNSAKSSSHSPSIQNQANHPAAADDSEVTSAQCVADVHGEWSPGKRTLTTSTPKPSCAAHAQVTPAKRKCPSTKTNSASKQLGQNSTRRNPGKRHGDQSSDATRRGNQSPEPTRSKYFTAPAGQNRDVDSSESDYEDDDSADTEETSNRRTRSKNVILGPKVTTLLDTKRLAHELRLCRRESESDIPRLVHRPVHTCSLRHLQSSTLCQWKRPFGLQIGLGTHCLSNGPSPLTLCKFNGHGHGDRHGDGEGTCKQALKNIPMFRCYLQRVIIFSAGDRRKYRPEAVIMTVPMMKVVKRTTMATAPIQEKGRQNIR